MLVETTRFGEIEVEEEKIIHFKEGILGFESVKKYFLIDLEEEDLFQWLHAVDRPDLAFIVTRPGIIFWNYFLDIPEVDVKELKIENEEEVDILAIVNVPEDPEQMTANLQGPLAINKKMNRGRQVISTNRKHILKFSIIKGLEEIEKHYNENQTTSAEGEK